jgi:hypothetical protein
MHRCRLFGAVEWILLVAGLFLLIVSLMIRSAWALDEPRMQRDLSVAEDVLGSLCRHGASPDESWANDADVRGLHVDGYGVVFLVDGCITRGHAEQRPPLVPQPEQEENDSDAASPEQDTETALAPLHDLAFEFLANYAGAIHQLEDDDHVTLILWPDRGRHTPRRLTDVRIASARLPPLPPLPPLPGIPDLPEGVMFMRSGQDSIGVEISHILEGLDALKGVPDSVAGRIVDELEARISGMRGHGDAGQRSLIVHVKRIEEEPTRHLDEAERETKQGEEEAGHAEREVGRAVREAEQEATRAQRQAEREATQFQRQTEQDARHAVRGAGQAASRFQREAEHRLQRTYVIAVFPDQAPLPVLVASVTRKQLLAHRRGRRNDEQLRAAISFQRYDPEAGELKSVDIMAGILERALSAEDDRSEGRGLSATGVYQKGLGALFFVDLDAPDLRLEPRWFGREEAGTDTVWTAYVRRVEEQLVEAVASYGHTLGPLQDGENVVVEVRFSQLPYRAMLGGQASAPTRLLLQAGKRPIQRFAAGKISLEQFREQVSVRR